MYLVASLNSLEKDTTGEISKPYLILLLPLPATSLAVGGFGPKKESNLHSLYKIVCPWVRSS